MSPQGFPRIGLSRALIVFLVCMGCARAGQRVLPEIRTDDVTRFFAAYDNAHGTPTAEQLQRDYLTPGTQALHEFVTHRIGSAEKLAAAIQKKPAVFADARRCASALPRVREALRGVFVKLAAIYPPARFPPVTLVVGADNTGGTTTPSGVVIGLETICRSNWLRPDITERFVHLIAHEYAHVQQPGAAIDPPKDPRLLYQALIEGGAEFVAELISGEVGNIHLQKWTQGQECRIEQEFLAAANSTDVSHWLYNGPGDRQHPGDLGYWVGYRIARAYYAHATDKKRAIADVIELDDADAFLKASGWTPAGDCGAPQPPT